jgi:hypothetical protein
MTPSGKKSEQSLSGLIGPAALHLLSAKGQDLVRQVGVDVVRGVIYNVLTGKNLRGSTEVLTRRRIAALNLASLAMFVRGSSVSDRFAEDLPRHATRILTRKRLPRAERWIAQWVLGLTDKAFQNVLRDDPESLLEYRDRYVEACHRVIAACEEEHGHLSGTLQLGAKESARLSWLFVTYLLNMVGAQTLAIRGSEKSAYGKLFEKLILGSLLQVLGFERVSAENPEKLRRVFWLSSRGQRRESDATLLYEAGKGIRIDIGFIGRGNPEISLDKVTRFERETTIRGSRWYMATLIIVDRIGPKSRPPQLAGRVGGRIVQMSMAYWPIQVARVLFDVLGYRHRLLDMSLSEIGPYLRSELEMVPIEELSGLEGD